MNIGNARLSSNKVIGGTLAWNQISEVKNGIVDGYGLDFTGDASKNTISITGTATESRYVSISSSVFTANAIANHVLLMEAYLLSGEYSGNMFLFGDSNNMFTLSSPTIKKPSNIANKQLYIQVENATTYEFEIAINVFDLTQMFGTAIADYILSLEQTTAGAGVAWFRKYFPDAYYDYNVGELLSVSGLISHDMTGFNQWDEVWENGYITDASGANAYSNVFIRSKNYIRILPDTSYYFHNGGAVSNADVYFYNANKEYLGRDTGGHQTLTNANQIFTTPSDAYYMRFYMGSAYGTTYRNNICINFSNPDLNGRYEPYQLYSYPLDSDLVLRGIPKLDTDNNLYYDGDIYEHDGKVSRKYGTVDLGTLNWNYDSANSMFNVPFATCKPGTENLICGKYYQPFRYWGGITGATSGIHMDSNLSLYIKDPAYTDAATFKTAMSSVMLVYELATPTTDTADPFTDPQEVSPYGTEEYISTGIVPVGNETQYLELSDTNM